MYADLVQMAVTGLRPGATGWVRAVCPWCGEGPSKRKLSYNTATGGYVCFRCHRKGRAGAGYVQPLTRPMAGEQVVEVPPPEGYYPLGYGPGATARVFVEARRYAGRRVSPNMWTALGIGACATGRYAGRVVIPVYGPDEETWLGWVARDYTARAARKYLYPAGMRTSQTLYNVAALGAWTDRPVLVVEGVLDAIHHWPDAVAVFGKPGEVHLDLLRACSRPVVFVLDGDAWQEALALAWRLRFDGKRAGMVKLPPGVDPDEVAPERLRALALESLQAEL